ncbi:hypothetical protein BDR04DRAFT_1117056 [Suillus decipiens]|nr:hypothetical protein BDR04DRAFT_1117056 [Suillus decipiens]
MILTPISAIPYGNQSPNHTPGGNFNMGQPGLNIQNDLLHFYQACMLYICICHSEELVTLTKIPKKTAGSQQVVNLLEHGTGIWLMQLPQYTEVVMLLEDFIDALQAAANKDEWTLVILSTIFMGEERFQYYYVVPNKQVIAWLEELNGELLFGECIQPSQWRHTVAQKSVPMFVNFHLIALLQAINATQSIKIINLIISTTGPAQTHQYWTFKD